jgi:DNA polymerase-3 subunit delta'
LINEELKLKAENNYHKIDLPKANQIKISSIRLIKRKLSLSGNVSGRRFVIISEAHKITNEASNAFLKTLEEPHDNITIILCTSRPEQILQTIISRCQIINCSPIASGTISEYLIENKNVDETQAKIAAQFGQGSLTKAINSVSKDLKVNRDLIVDIFRTSLKKRTFRSDLIHKIQKLIKDNDKKQIQSLFILLILWIRDAKSILIDEDSDLMINSDDKETISKFAIHFKNKDMSKAILKIEEHINMIDSNVNINLLIIAMFMQLRYIFIDYP